jgi:cell division protein ZapA (FtsZ GTPase activity inhibitor)
MLVACCRFAGLAGTVLGSLAGSLYLKKSGGKSDEQVTVVCSVAVCHDLKQSSNKNGYKVGSVT